MANLTAVQVRALKAPGRYVDGRGLMLVIAKDGSRKWVLRVQVNGRRRDIGLGSARDVSLAEARQRTDEMRRQIRDGLDPVAERKKARNLPTFKEAALSVHKEHRPSWKNEKHSAQWLSTLETYVFPKIGDTRVDQIDAPSIRDALAGIWLSKPETARRVRQRIGTVLDWAVAKGFRASELSMRSVTRGLPKQPKTENHFAALPWADVPEFLLSIKKSDGVSDTTKFAFEFLILTAARSGEVRLARWDEIDFDKKLWTIPAERMKAKRLHVVPLSARAMEILELAKDARREGQELIFEGSKRGRPLSDMTLTAVLRRMGIASTAHGFRSSFRDWASEATSFPREVAELSLAHLVGSQVERAYARSDLFEKRRELISAWEKFCVGDSSNLIHLEVSA